MMTDLATRVLLRLGVWRPAKTLIDRLRPLTPRGRRQHAAMLAFYAQFVRRGDLCFDIGANLGNRSDIFAGLGARVIAVEPQHECVTQLRKKYSDNPMVTVVPKAVGRQVGEGRLMVSQAHVLTSMSKEWVDRVKESGRFGIYEWERSEAVPVTTMDELIGQYGVPAFCKIDVEGYEAEVLGGLSAPIGAVSFEFAPEGVQTTTDCLERLERLGPYEFNYSVGESMALELPAWIQRAEMSAFLRSLPDKRTWGDVYARLKA
jgi:FkbM family methyltransferase